MVNGEEKTLLVHRKGSTRAFPPHHPLIPVDYQLTGQPVLIGGTMGTHSYVLTGNLGLPPFSNPPSIHLATAQECSLRVCVGRAVRRMRGSLRAKQRCPAQGRLC